jgi:cytochrome P450
VTILIAGHDTTALALAWELGEIAGHPEVVDRSTQDYHTSSRPACS